MAEPEIAFNLKVKFSFLCVFIKQSKRTVVLMRHLVRPPHFIPRNLFYPEQNHLAIFRYSARHRFYADGQAVQKKRDRSQFQDQIFSGPDLDSVPFIEEELTIHPNGTDESSTPSWKDSLQLVFPTSEILKATTDQALQVSIKDDYLDHVFVENPSKTVRLAGRVSILGGTFEVEDKDLTDGRFGLYEFDENLPPDAQVLIPGSERRVARAVTWNLPVKKVGDGKQYVEFRFRRLGAPTDVQVIQLSPFGNEKEVTVDIKNCEEEEIVRTALPQAYDEQLSRYELMSFYPLLKAWDPVSHSLPSCKLGPLAENGSGVCAPAQAP